MKTKDLYEADLVIAINRRGEMKVIKDRMGCYEITGSYEPLNIANLIIYLAYYKDDCIRPAILKIAERLKTLITFS